jgi:DNA invertase Pin-like site-specific DNA recombinase
MQRKYGYARVSTSRQTLDQQVDALVEAGVEPQHIFSDKMSGSREDRPGLLALLCQAREGDTITVVALDRLGRSLTNVIQTIDDLESRGIRVKSLREGVDFSTDMGRLLAGIFASLAEYERKLIKERAAAAREAARSRGKRVGRKPALTKAQAATARKMRDDGFPITEIAATLKVSRASVYRHTEAQPYLALT